jgi:hypothetical protein
MTIFQDEYKKAINNILKDIYGNTEYWGRGKQGNQGIVKPINDDDDTEWSNYNFINTHWSVRDDVVEPFVRQNGFDGELELNKSYKDSPDNRKYFTILWTKRHELFGPDSPLVKDIIGHINRSRGHGDDREKAVGKILNQLPFLDVEIRGAAGSLEDFAGTDAVINYKGSDYTAQIKPFTAYQKNGDVFNIHTKLIRKYNQDLMVFGKKSGNEYHIMLFWNRVNKIGDGVVSFPVNDMFMMVNYDKKTKKLKYKVND